VKVLITGGAGFIGTRLSRQLLSQGHDVTVLDCFLAQIHGTGNDVAPDLRGHVRLVRGAVQDADRMKEALADGTDVLVHFAAETGTGQSMYEICRYEDANLKGTAVLLDRLVNAKVPVGKLVVASSRAIYGEGAYACPDHGLVYPAMRTMEAMRAGQFEPECPICGKPCDVRPTAESAPLSPGSFYGLTKQIQEQMFLMFGKALGISAFALRYQNVFGPGQSLKNPYTGILAVFSNLARTHAPINVFEDGLESRDFVFVDDVVEATLRCIDPHLTGTGSFNVGSGVRTTVLEVAQVICEYWKSESPIQVTGQFRLGDIRHNVSDVTLLQQRTGFTPATRFHEGLTAFLDWAATQELGESGYQASLDELRQRGLMHG
jgi:dTDP-L-rhamnose 4-epimerase